MRESIERRESIDMRENSLEKTYWEFYIDGTLLAVSGNAQ